MKVYFSHGKEGHPSGNKINRLAAVARKFNCQVESIDYTDTVNPDERARRLVALLQREADGYILVGSSMGGYVSLVAAEETPAKGVFLMAPALFMNGYAIQSFNPVPPIEIVHGWSDDVIPPEHAIRFAKALECPLHLIPGDHRLDSAISVIERLFSDFLAEKLAEI